MSADDFLKGQADCKDGKLADLKGNVDYNRGYAAQYQHEQNMTDLGIRNDRISNRKA